MSDAELFVTLTNSDSVVFNGSITVVVENKVEFIIESVTFFSSRVVVVNSVLFNMGSVVFWEIIVVFIALVGADVVVFTVEFSANLVVFISIVFNNVVVFIAFVIVDVVVFMAFVINNIVVFIGLVIGSVVVFIVGKVEFSNEIVVIFESIEVEFSWLASVDVNNVVSFKLIVVVFKDNAVLVVFEIVDVVVDDVVVPVAVWLFINL
jgi:hypothetical protein